MVMDNKIIDGMEKESKLFKSITIVALILFLLTFVYMYVNNKSLQDRQVQSMLFVLLAFIAIGLYAWLYSANYSITISNTQILLKTLFAKRVINICDVKKYTCIRYKKSAFYQFNLFIKDKKVLINTRYKEEFEKILKDNKIEQIF